MNGARASRRDVRVNLKNLVSDKNPLYGRNRKNWKQYRELYSRENGFENKNKKKKDKEQIAYIVARTFFKMMIEDLIDRKDVFKFPASNFLKLRIARRLNKTRRGYKYRIETGGDEYCLWFDPGIRLFSVLSGAIYFNLAPKYEKRMYDNVINKHYEYPDGVEKIKIDSNELYKIRERRRNRSKNIKKNKRKKN